MEKALLRYCASFLTPDDKRLILRIKDQAKQMIQSEGDQSLVVTICLEVCLLQTTPNCCQTSARDSSPPRVSLSMSLSACNTWRTGPENFLRMSSEPCSPPVRCSVPAAHLPLLTLNLPPAEATAAAAAEVATTNAEEAPARESSDESSLSARLSVPSARSSCSSWDQSAERREERAEAEDAES
ncbi:hypothetical protein ZEAMMB73_Zm00001d044186 [Zea mays]|uniref:Uncharacterized protein n=1 Tax=Zea mays TaxID=4577 RepID=A0A1D6NIH9_MAIZE|nr:hypothetical protein ZEAMMB73_Zm00001d044186 [Zea mays]